jgi:hypothetical protein
MPYGVPLTSPGIDKTTLLTLGTPLVHHSSYSPPISPFAAPSEPSKFSNFILKTTHFPATTHSPSHSIDVSRSRH